MTLKYKRANKTETTNKQNRVICERIQTRVAFGWLNECSAEETSCSKNFPEINQYFALTSYCNATGQSNNAFSILGFSLVGK